MTKREVPPVFPIHFYCHDKYGFAESHRLAQVVWLRVKQKEQSWYGLDLQILSESSIQIFVRGMENGFHGGIGEVEFTTVVTELTPRELELLDEEVHRRKLELATNEWHKREEERIASQIRIIKFEMFGD